MALRSKDISCNEKNCSHFKICPPERMMKLKITETLPALCIYRPDHVYEYYKIYDEYSEIPISEINRVIRTLPNILDVDTADGSIVDQIELRQNNNLKKLREILSLKYMTMRKKDRQKSSNY